MFQHDLMAINTFQRMASRSCALTNNTLLTFFSTSTHLNYSFHLRNPPFDFNKQIIKMAKAAKAQKPVEPEVPQKAKRTKKDKDAPKRALR